MAEITAQMVKELRQATNSGVLECKKALTQSDGDFDAAVQILREKGLSNAVKKADREAKDGLIGVYVHPGAKMAGMAEVACETDFVARTDGFQQLAYDIAMHVVAAAPQYVSRADVPADVIASEKAIYAEQMAESGKPAEIIERITEGKLDKWYSEVCLLEQPFVKDPDVTIEELLQHGIATLGANSTVNRIARLAIGG